MRPASADKEETQAPDRFNRGYHRQTKQFPPRSSHFDFRERGESSLGRRRLQSVCKKAETNDLAECAGEYSVASPEIIRVLSNQERFTCLSFSTTRP
jgi:hypothetical protein